LASTTDENRERERIFDTRDDSKHSRAGVGHGESLLAITHSVSSPSP
jgi:hypothetical protein